jgi:anthranilate synthase/aminodeoxychorismate synthase-like glutamine amidotransferase
MQLLVIDNYDSFTYNLYDYLSQSGAACTVLRNDEFSVEQLTSFRQYDGVVLSPGPKRPSDAGLLLPLVAHLHQQLPILGICLGMQAIGEYFGARLIRAELPMHGKVSKVNHLQQGLFENIEQPTAVMRYHSLILENLPPELEATAWTTTGEIMALKHRYYALEGVQFHPESVLTDRGLQMISNWLEQNIKSRKRTMNS